MDKSNFFVKSHLKKQDDRLNLHIIKRLKRDQEALTAFSEAVLFQRGKKRPIRNIEQYFTSQFLTKLVRSQVPAYVATFFRKHLRGQVKFWRSENIFMVTEDDVAKAFFPNKVIKRGVSRSGLKKFGNKPKPAVTQPSINPETISVFTDWIMKTKFGYIPANSKIFADEMKKHSRAAFGRGMV